MKNSKDFVILFLVFCGCVRMPSPGPSERMFISEVTEQTCGYCPLPIGEEEVPGLMAFQCLTDGQLLLVMMRVDWIHSPAVDPALVVSLLTEMFGNRIFQSLVDPKTEKFQGNIGEYFSEGRAADRLNWLVNQGLYSRRLDTRVRVRIFGAEQWNFGEAEDLPEWTWSNEK